MDADAYAYCVTLTRDQWAWEFLRRNFDYRADYQAFIAIGRALEADYGAPPIEHSKEHDTFHRHCERCCL